MTAPWRWTWLIPCVAAAAAVSPASAQEIALGPGIANQLAHNLRVRLASGRVTAVGEYSGRNLNWTSNSGERTEQMKIDLTTEAPSLDYELSTAAFRIVVELDGGRELRIRRTPQGDGPLKPLEFVQPAEGPITIVRGANPPEKTDRYETVWHLLIADPELVRTEIEPLLRLVKPGWTLASDGQALEQLLYKQTRIEQNYDRRAWHELVEQLSSPHYVERLEADRKLRELGQAVVPYLRQLTETQLDAEQAYRIRLIVRRYGRYATEDTPETVAAWMSADPEVWYALARRAVGPQRTKAASQLSLLLGTTVELNPDADAAAHEAALAKVRALIDRAAAPAP